MVTSKLSCLQRRVFLADRGAADAVLPSVGDDGIPETLQEDAVFEMLVIDKTAATILLVLAALTKMQEVVMKGVSVAGVMSVVWDLRNLIGGVERLRDENEEGSEVVVNATFCHDL